jgi:hypothetical protein
MASLQELADEALKNSVDGEEMDIEKQIEVALECPCVGAFMVVALLLLFVSQNRRRGMLKTKASVHWLVCHVLHNHTN